MDSNADPSTNDYSFYNLKVIAFEDIDPNNYATISEMGVTKTYQDEVEFTNTEEWQRQYRYTYKTILISTRLINTNYGLNANPFYLILFLIVSIIFISNCFSS